MNLNSVNKATATIQTLQANINQSEVVPLTSNSPNGQANGTNPRSANRRSVNRIDVIESLPHQIAAKRRSRLSSVESAASGLQTPLTSSAQALVVSRTSLGSSPSNNNGSLQNGNSLHGKNCCFLY